MIITPKNVISIVIERKTKNMQFQFYDTKLQKWTFILTVLFFALGVVVALSTYLWSNKQTGFAAIALLLIGTLFSILYQLAAAIPELCKLRNMEKKISSPLLNDFNDDIDLINDLCIFEIHHLEFARESYCRMATQLRERLGLLVGAIGKVGLIPLAVTTYMAYIKAKRDGLLPLGGLEWLSISFLFLYILAIRMSTVAQWMEKISAIYKAAIDLKKEKHTSPSKQNTQDFYPQTASPDNRVDNFSK